MIRKATLDDFGQVFPLVCEWYEQSGAKLTGVQVDPNSILIYYQMFINEDKRFIFVHTTDDKIDGFVCGMFDKYAMDFSLKVLDENIKYAQNSSAIRELDDFIQNYAKECGVSYILQSCYVTSSLNRLRSV